MEAKKFVVISEKDLMSYINEYPHNSTLQCAILDIKERYLVEYDPSSTDDLYYRYDDLLKLIHDLTFNTIKDGVPDEYKDNVQGAVVNVLFTFMRKLNKIDAYQANVVLGDD